MGRLNTRVEQNKGEIEFWGRYCTFDPVTLEFPDGIPEAIHALGQAALALLDCKNRLPLEALSPDETFTSAVAAYEVAQARAEEVAKAIGAVNAKIAAKKEETGAVEVQTAETELARRMAINEYLLYSYLFYFTK